MKSELIANMRGPAPSVFMTIMSDTANFAPTTAQAAKNDRCRCWFNGLSFGFDDPPQSPTAIAAPDVTRSTTLRFDSQDPAA
jgi:hypothetical protein